MTPSPSLTAKTGNSVNRTKGKVTPLWECRHRCLSKPRRLASLAQARVFATHIERNDIPVLVDFWAQWCGPCEAMAPVYERVASEFEPQVRFLKVDTELEPELAARYNIRSIPTLMLFRKGAVIAQQAGTMDAQALRSWLRRHTASFPLAFQVS
jgi:thioredoxin